MWVRGLKLYARYARALTCVAPYVGAWIETLTDSIEEVSILSHPMWVRGLKLLRLPIILHLLKSHPMWVRGLKHKRKVVAYQDYVAPYVGAWIETIIVYHYRRR